ncbi:cell division protein FtsQ/DivIB [Pleurocapsa sp. PCC 7319]|uniref:cell division protein FtsQ/DivIB n=1 Tax=Pleurocapsa sp. PCC 7319 TaxID=118161 RepID=UPI0003459D6F|nr:FtsQ-type POTRA domain-containing protein [Pleurocapsa sp. PCC 7319]
MSTFPRSQLEHKLDIVARQDNQLHRIAVWRSCLVIGCAISLCLIVISPYWQIKHESQIHITGDKLVSENTVFTALDLSYPKSIWSLNELNLTQKIESVPSIATAKLNKQLLPPALIISLQERVPIALASSQGNVGFLDSQGEWIAQEFYAHVNTDFALPKLKVINYQPQYQKSWSSIYQLISLYPELEIDEVRWNQSGSLFLHTKLGMVFLGSDLSRLKQQFKIMLKLRNLPTYLERSKIAYIDLSNPEINLIQKY